MNILYWFVLVEAFSKIFCIGSQNSYLVLFSTKKYWFGQNSESIGIANTKKVVLVHPLQNALIKWQISRCKGVISSFFFCLAGDILSLEYPLAVSTAARRRI